MRRSDDKTHFIGFIPPEEVVKTIEDGRVWMRSRYGCRSGHSTPVHVTLVPPFKVDEGVRNRAIVEAMEEALGQSPVPFDAKALGWGSFSDRTIYGAIGEDKRWDSLRDELYKSLKNKGICTLRSEKGGLTPHLTVANRDIPKGAICPALEYFSEIPFSYSFHVESLVLFVRDGYRWVPYTVVSKA